MKFNKIIDMENYEDLYKIRYNQYNNFTVLICLVDELELVKLACCI